MRKFGLAFIGLYPLIVHCTKPEIKTETITVKNSGITELHDIQGAPEPIKKVARATVMIDNSGTASFVRYQGKNYLMTNHHVIGDSECLAEGCYESIVETFQRGEKPSYRKLFIKPVAANPDTDVAFFTYEGLTDGFSTDSSWSPAEILNLESHSAGELINKDIYVVGHPAVALKKWSRGTVFKEDNQYVSTTSFAIGGSSGSPVVTEDGTLVAIHHSGNRSIEGMSQTAFNRISYHSPTSLLINILETGLKNPTGASAFPFVSADSDDDFTRAELTRLEKARRPLRFKNSQTTLESYLKGLQNQCKESLDSLDKSPAASIAALASLTRSCSNASFIISCSKAVAHPFYFCPKTNDESAIWESLFLRLAGKYDNYPSGDGISRMAGMLTDIYVDKNLAFQKARSSILENLKRRNEPLTLTSAETLANLNGADESYDGTTVKDFILSYKNRPFYWLEYGSVVSAIAWLSYLQKLPKESMKSIFLEIAKDNRLSLADSLYLERTAYEWDALSW